MTNIWEAFSGPISQNLTCMHVHTDLTFVIGSKGKIILANMLFMFVCVFFFLECCGNA